MWWLLLIPYCLVWFSIVFVGIFVDRIKERLNIKRDYNTFFSISFLCTGYADYFLSMTVWPIWLLMALIVVVIDKIHDLYVWLSPKVISMFDYYVDIFIKMVNHQKDE